VLCYDKKECLVWRTFYKLG